MRRATRPGPRERRAATGRALLVASVVVSLLGSAGCSSSSSAPPAGTSPSPSASAGTSAPASAAPSSSAAAGLCQVISVQRMSQLTGFSLGAATDSDQSSGRSCTYTPTESAKKTDVALIVGTGELGSGTGIGTAAENAKSSFGLSKIGTTTVTGADAARVVTGKTSGVTTVFVIATKGSTYVSALTGGTRSTDDYTAAMRKVLAALLKG